MRPDERDLVPLWDMLNAAKAIRRFISGLSYESYLLNEEKRAAVQYEILTIGEAASRVSVVFRESYSDIPWRAIIAQRNVVAHLYDSIDDERIWEVATRHVPGLIQWLEALVGEPPSDGI